jgi:DNA ligase-1
MVVIHQEYCHPMATSITVRYADGLHLPELDMWLDPPRRKVRAFVSHAHSDHFARHDWTLCSDTTRALIERRYGAPKSGVMHPLPFGEPWDLGGFRLLLLPAGHILGSAMLHVTRLRDGATLLYTGDFKLRRGLTAEPAQLRQADTLVMETTFGRPQFRFPPLESVIADIHRFVREALADDAVPVLLGYSLGKAQEILATLDGGPGPIMVHPKVLEFTDDFRSRGCRLPDHCAVDPARAAGHVLVLPPNTLRTAAMRTLPPTRTAMLSGWALASGAKYRFQVDEALPLSDHADYDELLQCVEQAAPKRIFTVHGYTTDFARDLRNRGHDAWSLIKDEQMELRFPREDDAG